MCGLIYAKLFQLKLMISSLNFKYIYNLNKYSIGKLYIVLLGYKIVS